MVRVFIKGGVWKNSEDEILKAAVMKYGKQQWARVASLLNRKSAKQCKARWHEWLDPAVRKVEWSRAEEEKLLHLAKLMPAQWRTIAPLVGRTASQCQEHYEKLLDEAAGDATSADATLRQQTASQSLRPGQIDSHPETKPARPDPIDMDEDEIEMLQEARARLANTQGKKAKRKAREKALAEAKRLADLQKRRELKQAGLLSSAARKRARKRNRDIDLGVEIPFHKPAPAGFHDVSGEVAKAEVARKKRLKQIDYKQVNENQYRSRDREAAQAQKREEARLRNLERSNMQYVVAQVSKQNDPLATRKRGALELPAPSVSDQELGQLAKLTAAKQEAASLGDSSATQALLGDYSDRPLPTPMRTPMTGTQVSGHESLLREASNLRLLEQGQTPLLGGENPELLQHDKQDGASVAGATPMPDSRSTVGQTPLTVAPRDQLGLNRPRSELRDDASVGVSTFATSTASLKELAREERRAAKRARRQLEEALAALPAPQFEYELAAPQDLPEDEQQGPTTAVQPDAADLDAAERQRRQREAERLYEARSSVVKRQELPRPSGIIKDFEEKSVNEAQELIRQELVTLLKHDAHAFPVAANENEKKKKKRKKNQETELPPETPLDYLPEESLDMAKNLLQTELDSFMESKTAALMADGRCKTQQEAMDLLALENQQASEKGAAGKVYLDNAWVTPLGDEQVMKSLETEFKALQEAAAALRKKNDKIESKLGVKHGGYSKRAQSMRDATLENFAALQNAKIEEAVFSNLQSHEVRGGALRLERLKEEIAELDETEAVAQKHYADLLVEKKRLMVKWQSNKL